MVPISWSKWAHIEVWGHVQFSEARLPLRMRLYLTLHVVIDNSVCWGGVWSCVWGPFSCFVVLGLDSSLMETECIHLSHHQGNARARLNLRLRGCRIPQWCQDQETIFSLPQFSSDRERESQPGPRRPLQPGEEANGLCVCPSGSADQILCYLSSPCDWAVLTQRPSPRCGHDLID